jgi:hypothetical protein
MIEFLNFILYSKEHNVSIGLHPQVKWWEAPTLLGLLEPVSHSDDGQSPENL